MKKLLILLFSTIISFTSFPIYAEIFHYTCISNKGNFVITDKVDTSANTILHMSSYNPETGKRYKPNRYRKIIEWKYPIVFAYSISSHDVPTFQVFNFEKLTKSSAGHFEDDDPFPQFFQCVK